MSLAEEGYSLNKRLLSAVSSVRDVASGVEATAALEAVAEDFQKLKARLEAGEPYGTTSVSDDERRQLHQASEEAMASAASALRGTEANEKFCGALMKAGFAGMKFGQAAAKAQKGSQ
jgi:hypothetical protein